ncbi:ycf3-interacting protein 1, chloroplastic [Magnolia sinica]|uniref:ycf3-interacting protein 1, chloroplastic n=1 Tax=Magnolia sinica TaxID=86752 RepID=UPI002659A043|nr:ycf3-interacting protein 1, chloroplastic [Magnolia sinica]
MMIALHLPMPSLDTLHLPNKHHHHPFLPSPAIVASRHSIASLRLRRGPGIVFVGKEETELRAPPDEDQNAPPDDEELVRRIQRVLELLRKNRDMLFSEVKLTMMIEDPREAERKRLLGIENSSDVTRDDLVAALEDVNEGRIPENRVALQMLAEEMINWPNLEVAATKSKPSKSLYAKATDTGVKPEVAARRLNIDWDSAAEIEDSDESDEVDLPPAVGYGALYLVTALPGIIGISVVLILFYNSLQ